MCGGRPGTVTLPLTRSRSVLMVGGSSRRASAAAKTKNAMTMRNRPLMNPDKISTRSYLQHTGIHDHVYSIQAYTIISTAHRRTHDHIYSTRAHTIISTAHRHTRSYLQHTGIHDHIYSTQAHTQHHVHLIQCFIHGVCARYKLKGSVKEPNKLHIYETEKITHKASDVAEYIELFGSFTRDRHARRI